MKLGIIILHGWGSRVEKWLPFKKELERAGFEVFLPHLPGFGKTVPPKKSWGVSDYAHWVQDYIKENSLKNYFLVGHSFGGRIAIKIASRNPAGLTGLTLVNSAGIKPRKTLKRLAFLVLAKIGKIFFFLPPFCFFKSWAKWMLYKLAREKDYYQAKGMMRKTLKKVLSEDLRADLKKIKIPALILWGEKDKMTNLADGILMNNLIKNSSLITFPEAGHDLPLKFPKKTAGGIIKFCQKYHQ